MLSRTPLTIVVSKDRLKLTCDCSYRMPTFNPCTNDICSCTTNYILGKEPAHYPVPALRH